MGRVPEETDLRGSQGGGLLRRCLQEPQVWLPTGQIPGGDEPSRRVQGAPRRVHGRQREIPRTEAVRGVLHLSLLPQGLRQEEFLRKLSVKYFPTKLLVAVTRHFSDNFSTK